MEVALDSKNQEDEHSCFSDNTHRDILTNALGIRNVWLGEYKRLDGSVLKGPSLRDLVADKDAKAADKVSADMDALTTWPPPRASKPRLIRKLCKPMAASACKPPSTP